MFRRSRRIQAVVLSVLITLSALTCAWSRPDELPRPATKAEINRLIEQLGSRKFQVREQASRRLAEIGAAAYPRLRQIVHKHPDAEVRRRAACLLAIPAQLSKLRQAVAAAEKDLERFLARPGRLCDPASAIDMTQLALAEAKVNLAVAERNRTTLRAALLTVIRLREKRLIYFKDLLSKGAVHPADVDEEAERLTEAQRKLGRSPSVQ